MVSHLPFRILLGMFLGLSGGCAAQPDLLKLQQEVKHEKKQTAQREEVLQKHTDETREQLQRDQEQLREQLDEQHKTFTESHAALAEEMRQSLEEIKSAFNAKLVQVQVLGAELRGNIATVRDVELGGVIGRTEENQKGVVDLRLQMDMVSDELRGGDTKLQQLLRDERDHVRSRLADQATTIETLQSSLREVETGSAAQSKTLDDFGEVLGRRIGELEKHRDWVGKRTAGLIEKQAADMAAVTASLNEQRDSLAGFEEMLGQLGEELATQVNVQGGEQGERIQALSAQVQRMQGWVETRTQELAEQDAADMAVTALRVDELRRSLASFETALSNIGEQLSTQVNAQGSQQAERIHVIARQVQQMQAAQTATHEWVETRTKAIEEKHTADSTATAAQLEKLRGSLAGFEDAIVRLGEGVAVQISEQAAQRESLAAQMQAAQMAIQAWVEARTAELDDNQKTLEAVFAEREKQITKSTLEAVNQVAEVLAAVDKMKAQEVATMTRVNELTRFIDQLTTRVEQNVLAQQGAPGNE